MFNMGDNSNISSPNLNISAVPDEQYLDPAYQGGRMGLAETQSTLDFILEGLSQSLGMTQSQAATLLQNSQKFLMHMCVKGMKGGDFKGLIRWYKLILQFCPKLVELLEYEKNDILSLGMTFNVLKCGLFSSNAEVVNITGRALNKIQSHISSEAQHLQMMVWEWLTTSKSTTPGNAESPKKGKQTKVQKDLQEMIAEAGIISMIKAHRKHQMEITDIFSAFLVSFGRDNFVELFTFQLKNHCQDELEYLRILQDLLPTLTSTAKGKVAFVDSGSLSMILDMCIQICDFQFGSYTTDYRQVAIELLVLIWKSKPEIIQSSMNDGVKADTIIRILKNGCRDYTSPGVSQTSIHLSFYLLDGFAAERNMFAPILYKAMTFVLIESYLNIELRESLLKNFIHLFKAHPNIPVAILCEPLLKQIMINLEKQDSIYQKNTNFLQPNSEIFALNTTDFELFLSIANHPKINAQVAVPLLEIVTMIARKNIIFTRVSLKLLLIILARFENNTQIFQSCQKIITDLIKIITDQDAAKVELYNEIKDNPKTRSKRKASLPSQLSGGVASKTSNIKVSDSKTDKLDDSQIQAIIDPRQQQEQSAYYMSMKTSERLIINLLQCLIQTGIKVLSEFSREKLLDAYIKSEKALKFSNKGIIYLLKFFEQDVSKMIQFSMQQQVKEKTLKLQQKKQLQEQTQNLERARLGAMNKSVGYDGSESISDLKIMNIQIEKTFDNRPNQMISPSQGQRKKSIKTKGMSLIAPIINGPDKNRSLLRYGTKDDENFFREYESGLGSKVVHSPETKKTRKRKSVNMNKSYANKNDFYSKENGQIKLYELNEDGKAEQAKYMQWVKDWLKLYKAMFQKYADGAIGNSKKPGTFDNILDAKKFMNLACIFAFLQDFKVSKVEARREDIKRIIQLINIKQQSNFKTTSDLDLEGFIEFNLQLGYYLYKDQFIHPSKFMPMLFNRFKEVSLSTKTPLFQRLLENPNAPPIGDQHTIHYLSEQVNKYPETQLPPGYIKVKVDRIQEVDGPDPSIYKTESEKISVMVLNDMFFDIFKIALLQPMITYEQIWAVKHDTSKPRPKAKYSEIGEKHRFKGYLESEEEKIQLQKAQNNKYNTKKFINQRDSIDSDIPQAESRSSQSIVVQKRKFGSKSPEPVRPQYRAQQSKYQLENTDPMRNSEDMLDEMLGVGKRQLSHRSPVLRGNQVQQDRKNMALRDQEVKLTSQEKAFKRQAFLKNKLERYQQEKKTKDAQRNIIDKDAVDKQKQDDLKKLNDKKIYYAQIQADFETKRLPEIYQNKAKEEELKALLKEENKRKRVESMRRIDENTKSLQKQFTQVAKKKDELEYQERSLSVVKRFDPIGKTVSPRKQADIERVKMAKQNINTKAREIVKDLGSPPKNLTAEKQRLGLQKKSVSSKKDEKRNKAIKNQ